MSNKRYSIKDVITILMCCMRSKLTSYKKTQIDLHCSWFQKGHKRRDRLVLSKKEGQSQASCDFFKTYGWFQRKVFFPFLFLSFPRKNRTGKVISKRFCFSSCFYSLRSFYPLWRERKQSTWYAYRFIRKQITEK